MGDSFLMNSNNSSGGGTLGSIITKITPDVPAKYHACDGSVISTQDYPKTADTLKRWIQTLSEEPISDFFSLEQVLH